MCTYEVRVLDTPATLLLLQLGPSGFNIVLVRYASSYLFVRRLVFVLSLILVSLLFRAAGTALVTGRTLYIPSLGFGLVERRCIVSYMHAIAIFVVVHGMIIWMVAGKQTMQSWTAWS
jgi:hypothetical protein